jgi:hypothetical protein
MAKKYTPFNLINMDDSSEEENYESNNIEDNKEIEENKNIDTLKKDKHTKYNVTINDVLDSDDENTLHEASFTFISDEFFYSYILKFKIPPSSTYIYDSDDEEFDNELKNDENILKNGKQSCYKLRFPHSAVFIELFNDPNTAPLSKRYDYIGKYEKQKCEDSIIALKSLINFLDNFETKSDEDGICAVFGHEPCCSCDYFGMKVTITNKYIEFSSTSDKTVRDMISIPRYKSNTRVYKRLFKNILYELIDRYNVHE